MFLISTKHVRTWLYYVRKFEGPQKTEIGDSQWRNRKNNPHRKNRSAFLELLLRRQLTMQMVMRKVQSTDDIKIATVMQRNGWIIQEFSELDIQVKE